MSARRLWLARTLIGLVLAWNVQCALAFLLWPEAYAPGFALAGIPGAVAVRGTGILFLMWNVPYAIALSHPVRRRTSLYEAIAMQAIGLIGESLLAAALPSGFPELRASLLRFIAFDGAGLGALGIAAIILKKENREKRTGKISHRGHRGFRETGWL